MATKYRDQGTPAVGTSHCLEGDEAQDIDKSMGRSITPGTAVAMSLKTVVAVVIGIIVLVFGFAGTYFSQASTTKDLEKKQNVLEKRLDTAVTKEDLRALRLDVREDLLNSVWVCMEDKAEGNLKCRPSIPGEVRRGSR